MEANDSRVFMWAENIIQADEVSGFEFEYDLKKYLGVSLEELDRYCIELPKSISASHAVSYRPVVVNLFEDTRMTHREYLENKGVEKTDGYNVSVRPVSSGVNEVNPKIRSFSVVAEDPLVRNVDPRNVQFTDGPSGVDDLIRVEGSRLIGNLYVPFDCTRKLS